MVLVVGLGNPGQKYRMTRHNFGFLAIDHLSAHYGFQVTSHEFNAFYTQTEILNTKIIFAKPQTFMNHCGKSVYAFCQFYKIPAEKLIVFHDDVDLSFGDIRSKTKGGTAGHHGIESILEYLETDQFNRIRLGIGRPVDAHLEITDYVLASFTDEEKKRLPDCYKQLTMIFEKMLAGLK